jgi:trans-2,3-dihydro-3-hydroxyanthranilate isomerase
MAAASFGGSTMLMLRYRIVDVFTTEALEGNPLAVFTDGSQIDASLMQKIAREMNLAETTFVLPSEDPTCAARLRIFTPRKEMIFAGHPTIGAGFVLLDEDQVPKQSKSFFLEENIGKVQIWIEEGQPPMIWLRTPPISEGRVFDRSLCAQALRVELGDLLDVQPQLLDAGNPTLFVALKNKEAVDRAWLDSQGMMSLKEGEAEPFCVFVFAQTDEGAYSRMFAPDYGVPEDPATGSSTGPLAAFMMKHDLLPRVSNARFINEQGTKMLRRSLLHVKMGDDTGTDGIYIGGHVTAVAEGTMKL